MNATPNAIIALIGMMGSGKTTIGRILAEQTNRPFADTDSLAEEAAGMSVADIFSKKDEATFRKIESQVLKIALRYLQNGDMLSTGGGIILSKSNREMLHEETICVYLSASAETLAMRLANETTARPLLFDGNTEKSQEEITAYLEEILQERQEFYEKTAHITIPQTADETPSAIAQKVLEEVSKTQPAPQVG